MTQEPWLPLLRDAEADLPGAKQRLFTALYRELHDMAERQLRRSAEVNVSPTTLLHETYLDLAHGNASFPDRGRFMAYASRAMRGLIIDFARQRHALKRGADFHLTRLDTQMGEQQPSANSDGPELQRLGEALDELAIQDARLAEVVDLKYFCGFSFTEIAAMRSTSERTVQRDWEKARLILFREISNQSG